MEMNKKGYFFSLTVLLLMILIYIYFSSYTEPSFSRQSLVIEHRVQELNRIINLVEKDAEVGLKIASFRTIMDLNNIVSFNDIILTTDFEVVVEELLINGSVDGVNQIYSVNQSLNTWQDNVVLLFDSMGATAHFGDSNASFSQDNPWYVTSHYNTTLFVYDKFTTSNWSKKINVFINVDIVGFFDPLFSNQGISNRNIIRYAGNLNDLDGIISSVSYVASNNSPSFLQRFQNYESMPNSLFRGVGIESLVDASEFPNNKPIIDSLYFSSRPYTSCTTSDSHLLAFDYVDTYGVPCT